MRKSWNLRPAGAVDGAWIVFTMLTGFLLWLASGQFGAAQAQEPAGKAEPAAAKEEPAAAKNLGGDAGPSDKPAAGRRPPPARKAPSR